MSRTSVTLLLLAAAALHVCAAQEKRPVIDWLKNNKDTTTAAQLLQQLYPKPISDKAKLTLLIPTNDAIEAFRRDMHLTPAQFKERTGLLDLVVAYHIIPGFTAKELKVQKEPAVAVTGDINYVLRFYNTDKGVKVQDVQGNYVNLNTKPVVLGNAAIIVIDKVLMSGSYFFDGKAALSYYPQWSQAKSFAEAVGYPEGTSKEQDMTLLVPDDKAMDAAAGKLKDMSAADKKNLFLYHVNQPARPVPSGFKNGDKIKTNFVGHEVSVATSIDSSTVDPVTGEKNNIPTVVVTSETGNKANIKIYNVFVGQSIWQGIDAVLVPNFGSGPANVASESGSKAGSGNKNRRMLLAVAEALRSTAARTLNDARGSGDGYSQSYANTVSEQNTSRAIEAAATGKIPTSYATKYGSANAKAAASWGECWNCNVWN